MSQPRRFVTYRFGIITRGLGLGGHTHGGQVKPPLFDSPVLPVQNKNYVAGSYRFEKHKTVHQRTRTSTPGAI